MGAVEFARRDIVEAVIVIAGQPVGAIGIRPNPVLKRLLDPLQLVARSFGVDDIQEIRISASIFSFTKAMTSAAGIQGAPRRAVMSEGRKSAG